MTYETIFQTFIAISTAFGVAYLVVDMRRLYYSNVAYGPIIPRQVWTFLKVSLWIALGLLTVAILALATCLYPQLWVAVGFGILVAKILA